MFQNFQRHVRAHDAASTGAQDFGKPPRAGGHVEHASTVGEVAEDSGHRALFALVDALAGARLETIGVELRAFGMLQSLFVFSGFGHEGRSLVQTLRIRQGFEFRLHFQRAARNIRAVFATEKIVVAPEWQNILRSADLASVEAVYRANGTEITRSGSTQVMRVITAAAQEPRTLFIKKYWARGFTDLRKTWLRGAFLGRSKVRREFENLALLRAAGLDAPTPVAYGEERRARALLRSFLITESVENAMTLTEFIRDHLTALPPDVRRRTGARLINALADYTRRMHAARFVHHDYFWRNILLNGTSLEHFWLIDTPKGRRWRARELRHRAKDLATLDAAAPFFFRASERLAFFLRYTGARRLAEPQKKMIRRVLATAEPLREEQRRRVGVPAR